MRTETSKRVNIQSMNVHYYDNNISKETLEKIKQYKKLSINITKDNKLRNFNELRKKLEELNISNIAIEFYDKIINSYVKNDKKKNNFRATMSPMSIAHLYLSQSWHYTNEGYIVI